MCYNRDSHTLSLASGRPIRAHLFANVTYVHACEHVRQRQRTRALHRQNDAPPTKKRVFHRVFHSKPNGLQTYTCTPKVKVLPDETKCTDTQTHSLATFKVDQTSGRRRRRDSPKTRILVWESSVRNVRMQTNACETHIL